MDDLTEARLELERFLTSYLVERNLEKTLECLTEDLYSIGTGTMEVARDRAAFHALLDEELAANPEPFHLNWEFLDGKCHGDSAEFLGQVVISGNLSGEEFSIAARFTAVMRRENGVFKASSLHMSTAAESQEEEEFFPVRFAERTLSELRDEMEHKALDMLSNSIPGGMMGGYLEKGWPLYFVNRKMLEYLGFGYEEFVRFTKGLVINCMHPDDRDMVEEVVAKSLAQSGQYEVQYRMLKKDGGFLWIMDKGRRIETPEGRDAILSVCIDITESMEMRRELEEKTARLEAGNRELQRQQYFTSLLMSNNTVGMMIANDDPCGSFVYVGDNLIKFLGYEKEEFQRRFTDMRQLIVDEDWEPQREALYSQIAHGEFYQVEYRMCRKDGTRLWVQEQGQRNVEETGKSVFICTLLDISKHKRQQAQLERQSERDGLTRVYHRGAGTRHIAQYMEDKSHKEICALFLLDLDNFKRVNDTFGHITGDQVLVRLAAILNSAFRKSDIVMRLGGDEFVVLMKDVRRRADLERKAAQICERVRKAIDSRIQLLGLSVSIGVAVSQAEISFEELYKAADEALYRAKCQGKDGYCIIEDDINLDGATGDRTE